MARTSAITVLLFVTIRLLSHAFLAFGSLIAVIVDDQDPHILYTPEWHIGQICAGCAARVDKSQIYNGTWHDNSYLRDGSNTPQNATFTFNGSAIFVYGAQEQLSGESPADVVFYIDGQMVSTYTFTPTGSQNVAKYGQLLFSYDDLTEAPHTLMLQNGQVGGAASLVLLDYLVYVTTDNAPSNVVATGANPSTVTTTALPNASTQTADRLDSTARIAAIILGAVLFVAFLVIASMARTIRRQQRAGVSTNSTQANTVFLPRPLATADRTVVSTHPDTFTPTPFLFPARSAPPQKASGMLYSSLRLQQRQPPYSVSADRSTAEGQAMSELSVRSGGSIGGRTAPPAYQSEP